MTWLMALVTMAFLVACSLWLFGITVPFEVFVWGGLILICGWWVHDTARERREGVVA